MSKQKEMVSARLDPEVMAVVEQVASIERRPISSLVRNIVSDWSKARETNNSQVAA